MLELITGLYGWILGLNILFVGITFMFVIVIMAVVTIVVFVVSIWGHVSLPARKNCSFEITHCAGDAASVIDGADDGLAVLVHT